MDENVDSLRDDDEEVEVFHAFDEEESENASAVNPDNPEDQQDFNTDLPSMHSYLGRELEVVRGRTVLEDGAIVSLDLLQHADVVLMPGQTLPLTVFDPPTINMLRKCLRSDRTFGVMACWSDVETATIGGIGTTAEIYEYLPEEGSAGFRVKARARQRFKLLEYENNRWRARVRILPEVRLPDPLQGVRLLSLRRHCNSPRLRHRCRRADAAVTRWPAFVYEQYNVQRLVKQIKREVTTSMFEQEAKGKEKEKKKKNETAIKMVIPDDPTDLSFWMAQNLPMKEEERVMLLKLNSPIQRLRWELQAVRQCRQQLCCQYCKSSVGAGSDIFCMSMEGPQSTYVNPGGYLHEIITLYKVKNIYTVGQPSTEFSWFPGYAWTIAKCKRCHQHMGWRFTAPFGVLKPARFWGVCRKSIAVDWTLTADDEREDGENSVLLV